MLRLLDAASDRYRIAHAASGYMDSACCVWIAHVSIAHADSACCVCSRTELCTFLLAVLQAIQKVFQ